VLVDFTELICVLICAPVLVCGIDHSGRRPAPARRLAVLLFLLGILTSWVLVC